MVALRCAPRVPEFAGPLPRGTLRSVTLPESLCGRRGHLALAVVLTLAGRRADAQSTDVEALLRQGIALRAEGRDVDALGPFRLAYTAARSPVAAGQLGLAEQAVGRWVEAARHVHEALQTADDAWVTRNRAALEQAYAIIRQHVGALEILGAAPGTEVRVDGDLVGVVPLNGPLELRSGEVLLELRAPGYYPSSRRLMIAPASLTREFVELHPLAAETPRVEPASTVRVAPPQAPEATDRAAAPTSRRVPTASWWTGVGGLVLLAAAGGALAVREDAAGSFNGGCAALEQRGYEMQPADCQGLLDRGSTSTALAVTGFAVGGGLLATAVVIGLVSPRPAAHRALVWCGPAPLPGASCGGRF